jgi:hypothetical protein|tara:strand:- start:13791 stop:13955 length:165 start_codon:yes stop_codon:yes gene_type:complete
MFMHAVIPIRKPDDRYQRMIERGRATIYRMRCVKFRRRNRLPRNPHIRDATLIQ